MSDFWNFRFRKGTEAGYHTVQDMLSDIGEPVLSVAPDGWVYIIGDQHLRRAVLIQTLLIGCELGYGLVATPEMSYNNDDWTSVNNSKES